MLRLAVLSMTVEADAQAFLQRFRTNWQDSKPREHGSDRKIAWSSARRRRCNRIASIHVRSHAKIENIQLYASRFCTLPSPSRLCISWTRMVQRVYHHICVSVVGTPPSLYRLHKLPLRREFE